MAVTEVLRAAYYSTAPLTQVTLVTTPLGFEDENVAKTLQIDFANMYLGGGVLRSGCVQEEIRFLICPECLPGLLFCEVMDRNEAIVIAGLERFSNYSGYANTFKFAGKHDDPTPIDSRGRRATAFVAVDAVWYAKWQDQFNVADINRELVKAYAGFSFPIQHLLPEGSTINPSSTSTSTTTTTSSDSSSTSLPSTSSSSSSSTASSSTSSSLAPTTPYPSPSLTQSQFTSDAKFNVISTGNWGCGAFRGDVQLKFIIQWIAASLSNRPIRYFPYTDPNATGIDTFANYILSLNATVSHLMHATVGYVDVRSGLPHRKDRERLFDYIARVMPDLVNQTYKLNFNQLKNNNNASTSLAHGSYNISGLRGDSCNPA